MLKKRLLTALWSVPLVTAALWFGYLGNGWLFTAFIGVGALLGIIEFCRLAIPIKITPMYVFAAVWTLALIASRTPALVDIVLPYYDVHLIPSTLLTAGVVVSLIALLARPQKFNAFPAWAWTFAGILYMGWLFGYTVALYGVAGGRSWVFYALFCTFASDTAAYFIGRALGRHKMAPSISPGKTWEGAVGGVLGAIGISFAFLAPTPVSLAGKLVPWQAIVLGGAVSVFGQAGDLVESLLKRNVGVKDSGTLMAGHGGVLDRLDSIVFAIVIVYYWVVWMM
jgi:phosphatidate cytidylyltransferase